MTIVDKPSLFHVVGDRLSNTQSVKINFSNRPLWHRWLQPLWAVKRTLPVIFDNVDIASELASIDCGDAKSYREKLLAVLRQHLAAAKTKIEQDFYRNNDGSIYVAGQTEGDLGGQINNYEYSGFISKFDSSGNVQWTKLTGHYVGSLEIGDNDSIYITGGTQAGNQYISLFNSK